VVVEFKTGSVVKQCGSRAYHGARLIKISDNHSLLQDTNNLFGSDVYIFNNQDLTLRGVNNRVKFISSVSGWYDETGILCLAGLEKNQEYELSYQEERLMPGTGHAEVEIYEWAEIDIERL
jgi:hypothetical protein